MKVSLYVDDDLWRRFREAVLRARGTSRALSDQVAELIEDALTQEAVAKGFSLIGKSSTKILSAAEIKPVSPRAKTSAGKAIREMRGGRAAHIPG
jgi:hypothetical protein